MSSRLPHNYYSPFAPLREAQHLVESEREPGSVYASDLAAAGHGNLKRFTLFVFPIGDREANLNRHVITHPQSRVFQIDVGTGR